MKYLILLLALFIVSCDIALDRKDIEGVNPNCKSFLLCMQLNQKNMDKSVCLNLGEGCKSMNDFILCTSSSTAETMTYKDCLLLLRR
jgi:hypothetical protein